MVRLALCGAVLALLGGCLMLVPIDRPCKCPTPAPSRTPAVQANPTPPWWGDPDWRAR